MIQSVAIVVRLVSPKGAPPHLLAVHGTRKRIFALDQGPAGWDLDRAMVEAAKDMAERGGVDGRLTGAWLPNGSCAFVPVKYDFDFDSEEN